MPLPRLFVLSFSGIALAASLHADVVLAPVFGDGGVLQRDKPIPIWGRADPKEKVSVTFGGQSREVVTGNDGRWIAYLDPLPASAEGMDLVVAGNNTLTLRDVVVGEVWLCSGQSNMEWSVDRSLNAAAEIAAANFPLIRHVKIERTVAEAPADTVKTTGWQPATPENVGTFTAVGYYFARDLHRNLGVPIGLVNSTWGGTPVHAWMSPAALASDPAFDVVHERWQKSVAEYPAKKAAFDVMFAKWKEGEAAAKAAGKDQLAEYLKANPRPWLPPGEPGSSWTPSGLFNGMISPLLPYALRGVIWYQGESDANRAHEYHRKFSAMITSWRAHFGQGDVPFYWVNLANFLERRDKSGVTYANLREAQTKTLVLPNTAQALAIDIGDPENIHPRNKQEVGRRLALIAKARDYGIPGDYIGPTFVSAEREGKALRVRFAHAHGLVAHHKPVQSLEIAGADRKFYPATAKIERDTLLVSAPEVPEPVAVRYAWRNSPEANLCNGAGLPAVPFRSDDW